MKLARIELRGFRNFKKANINLENKSLIIGSNDIGKTNLLWSLRLLLDRSLTDFDLEPKDSDFYAYELTNHFSILLLFTEVTDDCVVSKMKGKISDASELLLGYQAKRDPITNAKSFKLFAGPKKAELEEIEDRYYRKVLNLKYISSRRDLHNYVNSEKNYLFQIAKENRSEEQVGSDEVLYSEIQDDLKNVDEKVPKLNFISAATNTLNDELGKLSLHHKKQEIVFDAKTSNVENFIKSVSMASKNNNQHVVIGGDGRLNQIYLALWASRNGLTEENLKEVTIFCIEEPEAHLHPHQERKLAEYLNTSLQGQVILTSHSPMIAAEFSPNSIARLYNWKGETLAASEGCSEIIDESFVDFGYRMSVVPATTFYSDVVLLIEGSSEELFYQTLASINNLDLDRLNISILKVDGVGFGTYINILNALEIEWVLRTDKDIFKIPKKEKWRFAGIQRCIGFYRQFFEDDEEMDKVLIEHEDNLVWETADKLPEQKNIDSAIRVVTELKRFKFFISDIDLENDLLNSPIRTDLEEFFESTDGNEILALMQKRKASFMFDFLRNKKEVLTKLKTDEIFKPLDDCYSIVQSIHNETD